MKPEKVFRVGCVTASVFHTTRESKKGKTKVRRVNLHRRYQEGTEWKSSTYYGLSELPQAMAVLKLALNYVAEMEAEVTEITES